MKYYIYRVQYADYLRMNALNRIKCSLDEIMPADGDMAILIVSKSLLVLGAYKYNAGEKIWTMVQNISKPVTEFYGKLPMVKFVNDRTYKLFAKRIREIDQENYLPFLSST